MKAPPRNIAEGTAEQKGSSPCSLFPLDNGKVFSTIYSSSAYFMSTTFIHIPHILLRFRTFFAQFLPNDTAEKRLCFAWDPIQFHILYSGNRILLPKTMVLIPFWAALWPFCRHGISFPGFQRGSDYDILC